MSGTHILSPISIGNGEAISLGNDWNGAIELGRRDNLAATTPFIDFHTDGSSTTDFNSRIIATGNIVTLQGSNGTTWRLPNAPTISSGSLMARDSNNDIGATSISLASVVTTNDKYTTYIGVDKGSDMSLYRSGYWAAMCNSGTVPTPGLWWHILSMDSR